MPLKLRHTKNSKFLQKERKTAFCLEASKKTPASTKNIPSQQVHTWKKTRRLGMLWKQGCRLRGKMGRKWEQSNKGHQKANLDYPMGYERKTGGGKVGR